MRKRLNEKKTNRELAIEALEILKNEGIDVTQIAPKRKFNGERRYIVLKEVKDERINEIIEKYGLNPDLKIGSQIYIMRTLFDKFDESERKKILSLGIKKKSEYIVKKNGSHKNQIEEYLELLEKLREEGIDTAFIPQIVKGEPSKLKDIDSPATQTIINKLGLDKNLPIGRKISIIISEYSEKNKRHDYQKSDNDIEKINRLGILKGVEERVDETMDIFRQLEEKGIDFNSAKTDVVLPDGRIRKRYLCEIEDENIEQAISELGLPRYCVIGKRLLQVKNYIISEKYPKEKRDRISDQLINWRLYKVRDNIPKTSKLVRLEMEQKDLQEKMEQAIELEALVESELERKNGKTER